MSDLVYFALTTLDGFVADPASDTVFPVPDDEVHAYINAIHRTFGHHIYDQYTWELMSYWERPPASDLESPQVRDYAAIWQAARKTVVSPNLDGLDPGRCAVVRELTPETISELKASDNSDLMISGKGLAELALRAGLLDRIVIGILPVLLGHGDAWLAAGDTHDLTLLKSRSFTSGWVFLDYCLKPR